MTTGEKVDNKTWVSVFVTDESVFSEVDEKKQPPSYVAKVYLEHEVNKTDYEFYYASEYI